MRDKIVYLLGAGFSAPLGLPLVSNFISKSKDLYFEQPGKYSHFLEVHKLINSMARAKNYFATELSSIEEVLSILEMEDVASGDRERSKRFVQFLRDTIGFYTPEFSWKASGRGIMPFPPEVQRYAAFVASLFGVQLTRVEATSIEEKKTLIEKDVDYAVLSLNYDQVLEKALALINAIPGPDLLFTLDGDAFGGAGVALAKLHGSVELLSIVPPTWNKTVPQEVEQAWHLAFEALSAANQIRIIGYSLPSSDAYIRYLFKASILRSEHLKHIDILCLDPDGSVRRRFAEFITFAGTEFVGNLGVEDYLYPLIEPRDPWVHGLPHNMMRWIFSGVEDLHQRVFGKSNRLLHGKRHD
jgi:hypothetical protein